MFFTDCTTSNNFFLIHRENRRAGFNHCFMDQLKVNNEYTNTIVCPSIFYFLIWLLFPHKLAINSLKIIKINEKFDIELLFAYNSFIT